MTPNPLRSPAAAIALTGLVALASALGLLASDLTAADAALTRTLVSRPGGEAAPSGPRRAVEPWAGPRWTS